MPKCKSSSPGVLQPRSRAATSFEVEEAWASAGSEDDFPKAPDADEDCSRGELGDDGPPCQIIINYKKLYNIHKH